MRENESISICNELEKIEIDLEDICKSLQRIQKNLKSLREQMIYIETRDKQFESS